MTLYPLPPPSSWKIRLLTCQSFARTLSFDEDLVVNFDNLLVCRKSFAINPRIYFLWLFGEGGGGKHKSFDKYSFFKMWRTSLILDIIRNLHSSRNNRIPVQKLEYCRQKNIIWESFISLTSSRIKHHNYRLDWDKSEIETSRWLTIYDNEKMTWKACSKSWGTMKLFTWKRPVKQRLGGMDTPGILVRRLLYEMTRKKWRENAILYDQIRLSIAKLPVDIDTEYLSKNEISSSMSTQQLQRDEYEKDFSSNHTTTNDQRYR